MKNKFIIAALALALVVVSAKLFIKNTDSTKSYNTSAEEIVYQNILTRASVRAYTEQTVEAEKVEKLLRAGMAAPTARDQRPWHFVVVDDRDVLDSLANTNKHGSMLKKAPLAIVVCGDMDLALEGIAQDYWIQDCSAAIENILLAAHGMGLGAVWTGNYPIEERITAVKKVLHLPSEIIPLGTLVIGYPAQKVEPKDKWDESNISYNEYGGSKDEE